MTETEPSGVTKGGKRCASVLTGNLGQGVQTLCQILVGGDVVGHLAVVELLIRDQIEVACTRQTEYDGLFLACFLALERFVDRDADRVDCCAASNTEVCSTEVASM